MEGCREPELESDVVVVAGCGRGVYADLRELRTATYRVSGDRLVERSRRWRSRRDLIRYLRRVARRICREDGSYYLAQV